MCPPRIAMQQTRQDRIMCKLLRLSIVIFLLGFRAFAFAQSDDDPSAPFGSADCRAIDGQAEIDGTMQEIVGRACRQPDGTWQVMRDDSDGRVLVYPAGAYPYPDPWYWGPPLFVGVGASFVFVDRFHHFHHFHQFGHDHFGRPHGGGFHGGNMHAFGGMHGGGGMHGFGGGRR